MEIGLILGLLKVAIETFHDERKGHFSSKRDKLEKEWLNEMAESPDTRSDLKLDQLLFDINQISRDIIEEHSK